MKRKHEIQERKWKEHAMILYEELIDFFGETEYEDSSEMFRSIHAKYREKLNDVKEKMDLVFKLIKYEFNSIALKNLIECSFMSHK